MEKPVDSSEISDSSIYEKEICYVAIVYPKKNINKCTKGITTGLINQVSGGLCLPRFGAWGES